MVLWYYGTKGLYMALCKDNDFTNFYLYYIMVLYFD